MGHKGKGHGAALPVWCCSSGSALSTEGLPSPEHWELEAKCDAGMGGSRWDLPQAGGHAAPISGLSH